MAEPPSSWIRRLWERMGAAYGHAWASANGASPHNPDGTLTIAGDTWAKALSGIDGRQLAAGLEACFVEGAEFPPSAPRFRGMCLGIPSFARVKLEATQPDAQRSPFTRAVWMHVDGYAYRHASSRDAERMLRDAYDIACDERMRGAALPAPAAAEIEHEKPRQPEGIPESREARCKRLQSLLGQLYNPAVEDPNFDPAEAHKAPLTPSQRAEAEADLARLRAEEEG